jgi:hypothetical protein
MPRFDVLLPAILVASLISVPATAQSIATNSPTPLSTRVTSYNIDAKLDTAKKSLDATETVSYKNLTGQPLTSVPFHLYLNAFRPQSSFTASATTRRTMTIRRRNLGASTSRRSPPRATAI